MQVWMVYEKYYYQLGGGIMSLLQTLVYPKSVKLFDANFIKKKVCTDLFKVGIRCRFMKNIIISWVEEWWDHE